LTKSYLWISDSSISRAGRYPERSAVNECSWKE
jgi:hypothetical protein